MAADAAEQPIALVTCPGRYFHFGLLVTFLTCLDVSAPYHLAELRQKDGPQRGWGPSDIYGEYWLKVL